MDGPLLKHERREKGHDAVVRRDQGRGHVHRNVVICNIRVDSRRDKRHRIHEITKDERRAFRQIFKVKERSVIVGSFVDLYLHQCRSKIC